jgi:hypothetical protein
MQWDRSVGAQKYKEYMKIANNPSSGDTTRTFILSAKINRGYEIMNKLIDHVTTMVVNHALMVAIEHKNDMNVKFLLEESTMDLNEALLEALNHEDNDDVIMEIIGKGDVDFERAAYVSIAKKNARYLDKFLTFIRDADVRNHMFKLCMATNNHVIMMCVLSQHDTYETIISTHPHYYRYANVLKKCGYFDTYLMLNMFPENEDMFYMCRVHAKGDNILSTLPVDVFYIIMEYVFKIRET